MKIKKIAFAGLGLIGGSLALSFAENGIKLIGYDRCRESVIEAGKSGKFEYLTDSLDELLSFDFDILYIALPVRAACEFVQKLGEKGFDKPVTDAGSTKLDIVEAAGKAGINFCGGHPIAGKEVSGFKNARSGLFYGAYHILTPVSDNFDVKELGRIHTEIGMKVSVMNPERHDKVFGLISHLPHVSAFALVQTVFAEDEDAFNYTGAGFRDFTRIAASDARMWTDIFLDNDKNMVKLIDSYIAELSQWRDAVSERDEKKIYEMIDKAAGIRRALK
jgi:prephenate dehydrogenase